MSDTTQPLLKKVHVGKAQRSQILKRISALTTLLLLITSASACQPTNGKTAKPASDMHQILKNIIKPFLKTIPVEMHILIDPRFYQTQEQLNQHLSELHKLPEGSKVNLWVFDGQASVPFESIPISQKKDAVPISVPLNELKKHTASGNQLQLFDAIRQISQSAGRESSNPKWLLVLSNGVEKSNYGYLGSNSPRRGTHFVHQLENTKKFANPIFNHLSIGFVILGVNQPNQFEAIRDTWAKIFVRGGAQTYMITKENLQEVIHYAAEI